MVLYLQGNIRNIPYNPIRTVAVVTFIYLFISGFNLLLKAVYWLLMKLKEELSVRSQPILNIVVPKNSQSYQLFYFANNDYEKTRKKFTHIFCHCLV